jgi:hypothetical protein
VILKTFAYHVESIYQELIIKKNMYSVTQGSNIAAFIAVLVLLSQKFNLGVSADDITIIVSGLVALVAVIISFVNRYKKGDVTIAGAYLD